MKKLWGLLLAVFLISCSGVHYHDGTYTGVGAGHSGSIKVEVVIVKGKISRVNILEYTDTPGISDEVFAKLPSAIVRENSTEVDTISGATDTSRGVLQAVNNALKKAAR